MLTKLGITSNSIKRCTTIDIRELVEDNTFIASLVLVKDPLIFMMNFNFIFKRELYKSAN